VPRTRPPYPLEFRAEAVRLVRTSSKLIREVAEELGAFPSRRFATGCAEATRTTATAADG
jgi:transposase-like protein